jgi:hypothetical protein
VADRTRRQAEFRKTLEIRALHDAGENEPDAAHAA